MQAVLEEHANGSVTADDGTGSHRTDQPDGTAAAAVPDESASRHAADNLATTPLPLTRSDMPWAVTDKPPKLYGPGQWPPRAVRPMARARSRREPCWQTCAIVWAQMREGDGQ